MPAPLCWSWRAWPSVDVDPAAFELARSILQGGMRQIEITADMMGMCLAREGDPI